MKIGQKKKKGPPAWTHPLIYAGMRSALTVPLVAGTGPSLRAAAGFGRWYGSRRFNRKRVERAAAGIMQAYPERSPDEARELALSSYAHLFRLGIEVAFTPRLMTQDGMLRHVEIDNVEPAIRQLATGEPTILISGHCGNWELLAYIMAILGYPMHAIYRPLDIAPIDQWLYRTRSKRGLSLIDKFGAMRRLEGLVTSGRPVGFTADQNAGDRGVFVPFFGRLTSTYKSIGLLALKTRATLVCGGAYRLSTDPRDLGGPVDRGFRYRFMVNDVIRPEDYEKQPDPLYYMTARYRRAIEDMIRRAPEQYLWMHRVWKSRPAHERHDKPFPDQLREKLRQLPWMTESELGGLIDRSDRDRETLRRLGTDRLP